MLFFPNSVLTPKCPFSNSHDWYITGAEPSYTLEQLAEYLDLAPSKYAHNNAQADNDDHFGRNCATFHHTRHRAYKIADKLNEQQLFKQVLVIAEEFNANFDKPMLPNETYHIARSITRFCKSPRWGKYNQAFIEKQRQAGRKGDSSQGGKARSANYEPKRQQAEQMHKQGVKIKDIAQQLKVTRQTLNNWGIKARNSKQK